MSLTYDPTGRLDDIFGEASSQRLEEAKRQPSQGTALKALEDNRLELDEVDEAAWESFPASDPPAWTGAHAGGPSRQQTLLRAERKET